MAPTSILTSGSIKKILNGEDVPNPVIQILDWDNCVPKKEKNKRYRLVISDGVTSYSFAMLGTHELNQMMAQKELDKYTVVRVDKYVCNEIRLDEYVLNKVMPVLKTILLLNWTVLNPGIEVGRMLGNPHNFIGVSSKTRAPVLTSGSIKKILNGKHVPKPVFQILGCNTYPGHSEKNKRYRLLISDGVTSYSYATLGTQVNHMVMTKELEKLTVIRVNKYVCNEVKPELKVIFLLNLTVLNPGIEVERRLGNPINFTTVSSTSTKHLFVPHPNVTQESWKEPEIGIISDAEMIKFLNLETHTMAPSLSTGSINEILNGDEVPNAVLQILGSKTITVKGYNCYRFMISDGVIGYPFAILSTDLNHMVTNKELERFTVIRVDNWSCRLDDKTILLHSLTVLVPGNEINEMLGDPFNSNTASSTATLSEKRMNGTVHPSGSARS